LTSHDYFHNASIELGNPTVSIGVAVFPEEAATKEDLIQKADHMLYQAKQSGKNQVCIEEQKSPSSMDH
jgi:diguanylate cyclase (GGDEF)-like protein